jgi:ParB-like nuclease domain
MEYWNKPKINCVYAVEQDPVKDSFHNGNHCLFYDPSINKNAIRYEQKLEDICEWINKKIKYNGIDGFVSDPMNHYDIANLVKLNMWVDDIRKQGIVKPILVYYDGQEKYGINNGESRLRALERIPGIDSLAGFISTRVEHADQFKHLVSVVNFKQFAELCKATDGQQFMFTITDPEALYGLFWFEYNSHRTEAVTPGGDWCVKIFHNYLKAHPGMLFTPDWFDTLIVWNDYAG